MTDTTELRAAIRVWADSDEIYGRLTRAEALRKAADRIEALSARVRELEEARSAERIDAARMALEAAKEEWTDSWSIFDCRIRAIDPAQFAERSE